MPANPNFDDIVTTTLRNRSGKLADNATRTTVLLDRMRRKGKVKPAAGGRTIVQELEVALNTNGGWYAGYDPLNTNPFEPFSAAEYDWKQAYVPVVWSGLEKLKNMGEFEVIDLDRQSREERREVALRSRGIGKLLRWTRARAASNCTGSGCSSWQHRPREPLAASTVPPTRSGRTRRRPSPCRAP